MSKVLKLSKTQEKRLKDLKKDKSPEAIRELIRLLSHKNRHVECEARDILEKNLSRKHIDILIDYLNSPGKKPWGTIDHVIDLLEELKAKKAIPAIAQYFRHKNYVVRMAVAQELGYLDSEESIPTLLAMLDDPRPIVYHFVCYALIYINDISIKGCLEEKFNKAKTYGHRLYLAYTMYMLGEKADKERLEYVLKCLTFGSEKRIWYIRRNAAEVLYDMAEVSCTEIRQTILDALKKALDVEPVEEVKTEMQTTIGDIERLMREEEEKNKNNSSI